MTNKIYLFLSQARWILIVFYLGLAAALVAYGVAFLHKLWKFVEQAFVMDEVEGVVGMLGLIDSALVAGLVIMVIQSGFANFVGQPELDGKNADMSNVNFGALKTKFLATIAAIASIDVLEAILDIKSYELEKLIMLAVLMMVIMLSVLIFAIAEKLEGHGEK